MIGFYVEFTRRITHRSIDDLHDMLGSIPQNVPNSILQGIKPSNYGTILLENESNMYDGIMNNTNDIINNNNRSIPQISSKRTMHGGLYWNNDEATTTTTTIDRNHSPNTKRFLVENNEDDGLNMNNISRITNHEQSSSIANFLSQFPQNPSIQQQQQQQEEVLGSLNDGVVFRQPYNQVTGMNWYS